MLWLGALVISQAQAAGPSSPLPQTGNDKLDALVTAVYGALALGGLLGLDKAAFWAAKLKASRNGGGGEAAVVDCATSAEVSNVAVSLDRLASATEKLGEKAIDQHQQILVLLKSAREAIERIERKVIG